MIMLADGRGVLFAEDEDRVSEDIASDPADNEARIRRAVAATVTQRGRVRCLSWRQECLPDRGKIRFIKPS